MKKKSRLAIVSFLLGCIGAWCALVRPGLITIPLGLAALFLGIVAQWVIRRPASKVEGRGLAVSAVALGALSIASGVAVLIGLWLQQFSPQRNQQETWERHREAEEAHNRMPETPAAEFSSNLAIAVLDTSGQMISKGGTPTVVRARFFDVDQGRASLHSKAAYDGLGTIHLRGYTTLHLPKLSYTFHTVDSATNQTKVPLLGLPAEADWVLYAPYEDKTLIRDVLAYELANSMGRYAPHTRYVELFLHDSDRPLSMRDYAGIYVLVEKIKRGKHRVNIAKLEPTDRAEPEITGGYIIKRDHSDRGESHFRTRHGGPYSYVYPKGTEITAEQRRWLTHYFNSFESALYGPSFTDEETGYAAYLDVASFIDAHWLIEMGKNVDGFRYSAFLTKDRGGKIKPEPPWDWNRAFGNANYYGGGQPQGWYWSNLRPNEISWYQRLREDPHFEERCNARWLELRKEVFDPKRIDARIDQLAAQLDEAQQRNFRRWPVLGRHITCNYYVGRSYRDEVSWLKKWIDHRIQWIDGQIGNP